MSSGFLNFQKSTAVRHDLVNSALGTGQRIPHEWYFLSVLVKEEILKNQKLAEAFVMFVFQYYPNYKWHYIDIQDYLATAVCECELHSFQFQKKYEFGFEEDEDSILGNAMILGDIATDFLIRYCNYSLIECSEQKVIITAQSDCYKRFEELLAEGYSLQRKAKVGYLETPDYILAYYPEVKGIFYKLPVLPTRDIGYNIDEIIETDTGEYVRII